MRFYLVAMIFIIFDIEIVFLYPWAVVFRQLHTFGLIEVLVFAGVVFVSFLYLVSNGALNWGPAKRLRPGDLDAHHGVDHRPGRGPNRGRARARRHKAGGRAWGSKISSTISSRVVSRTSSSGRAATASGR